MTSNPETVLVLTDETMELVRQEVRAVNTAQPVIELVKPQINPLRGPSSNRSVMNNGTHIVNEKSYFTCLKRK